MKLDPTSLKLFVSVVEEKTIAAAADREHIAAAAVSKRMTELESTLRTKLLTRTNKGVEPTAAGTALLGLARQALRELDEVFFQMQDYARGTRGQIAGWLPGARCELVVRDLRTRGNAEADRRQADGRDREDHADGQLQEEGRGAGCDG